MSNVEELSTVPKLETSREGSYSTGASSPDPEPELDGLASVPEHIQVQKRKGGRKPIYATSEERKQRNRQAQAAFRERRTEYIKQLETTIKHQEETLQNLQQNHRAAADECLMLRYKNSLLERILLEKGIDVQAELKTRTDSGTGRSAPGQSMPLQRPVTSQHQNLRRSVSGNASRLIQAQKSSSITSNQSPQLQPKSPSSASSPTASRSPKFALQGGMISPHSSLQAQQQLQQSQKQQQHQQHSPLPPQPHRGASYPQIRPYPGIAIPTSNSNTSDYAPSHLGGQRGDGRSSAVTPRSNPWPSPYQTHIEQLEQEYDAHADMIDDTDPSDHSAGPGPYPQPFQEHPYHPNQQQPPLGSQNPSLMQPPTTLQPGDPRAAQYGSMNQIFDPFDSMLDADPFGLTASMQFPTQFSFQESSMRK